LLALFCLMKRIQYDEDLFADSTMTFGEHLEELRKCLWRAIWGLIGGIILGMAVGGYVVEFIQMPLTKALEHYYQAETEAKLIAAQQSAGKAEDEDQVRQTIKSRRKIADQVYIDPAEVLAQLKTAYPKEFQHVEVPKAGDAADRDGLLPIFLWHKLEDDSRVHVKSFSVHEAFGIYVKAAILVGLLLASPWIFYQIWTFVAAGLYPHEKHYVHFYLPLSIGLFFFGAAVAFSFVFEPVLNFLFSVNRMLGIELDPRISEWLGFALILPVSFGIGFQLPLVMYFLERVGIVSPGTFTKHWKIAILIIWILVTMLTPPDPFSQFFLGIPLTFLYFGGILLCKYMPDRKYRSRSA
jgi:sec-independent protein translocase protein TatC